MSAVEDDLEIPVADVVHAEVVARARRYLEDLEQRRTRDRTPQLRTIRRRGETAMAQIDDLLRHLPTLHTLAYDRPAAARRLRASGAPVTGFVLDENGDRRAREILRRVGEEFLDLLDFLTLESAEAMEYLREGERLSTVDRHEGITSIELAERLDARERRVARGEAEQLLEDQPAPRVPTNVAQLLAEREALEDVLLQVCPSLKQDDRQHLTTLQVSVHRRAVDAARGRREQRLKRGRRWR